MKKSIFLIAILLIFSFFWSSLAFASQPYNDPDFGPPDTYYDPELDNSDYNAALTNSRNVDLRNKATTYSKGNKDYSYQSCHWSFRNNAMNKWHSQTWVFWWIFFSIFKIAGYIIFIWATVYTARKAWNYAAKK